MIAYIPHEDPLEYYPDGDHSQDIYLFNYDWRLDLNPDRANESLNESTPTMARLDSLVSWIKVNHAGSDQLTVVCHSMGGLLAQAYMLKYPEHGIKNWITLGTPFQGSVNAMATLFGRNGGGLGKITSIPAKMGELNKDFVSCWELLPTPYFDSHAPYNATNSDSGPNWAGHAPYHDETTIIESSGWGYPYVVIPNMTMAAVKNSNPDGWYHNNRAKNLSEVFQNAYMGRTANQQIDNVNTWVIAGINEETLRGVVKYTRKRTEYHYQSPNPIIYNDTMTDLVKGSGDGIVPLWSATTPNVNPDNLDSIYANGVEHEDLIRDPDVALLVESIIRNREFDYLENSTITKELPADGSFREPWMVRWHTDVALWSDNKDVELSTMDEMPVTLEIVDRSSNKLLVGLVHFDLPSGSDYVGPRSFTMALDPRFSVVEHEGGVDIYSTCRTASNLRIIVRPHPSLYDPAEIGPAKDPISDLLILGHLSITGLGRTLNIPRPDDTDYDFVEFTSMGGAEGCGFGAYSDIRIGSTGIISPNSTLKFHIDSNGDGSENWDICSVEPESQSISRDHFLEISPNPSNPGTHFSWAMTNGTVVDIRIYDISGRLVRTINAGGQESGKIYFDGSDDSGKGLSSGVYFARIVDQKGQAGSSTKFTIVK